MAPTSREVRGPAILLLVEQRDWLEGARFPRFFHDAGLSVDLFARRGSIATRSRRIRQCFEVAGSETEYFEQLGALLDARAADWQWIFPITDVDVRGIAQRLDRSWARVILPVRHDPRVLAALHSKAEMDRLLSEAQVPVPRSLVVRTAREVEAFVAASDRPVLLKPVDGVGGGGVVRLDGSSPISEVLGPLLAKHPGMMVQEYIEGRVGSCQAVFRAGVPLAWATSFKRRTWPGPFGPTSEAHFAPIPEMATHLPRIGEALGFNGILSLDLIVEPSGRVFVIEVNPRPAGLMTRARRAGVDFEGAVRALVSGGAAPGHPGGTRRETVVPLFPQTMVQALAERDLGRLVSLLRPASLADVPWGDPRLVGSQLRHVIRKVVNG